MTGRIQEPNQEQEVQELATLLGVNGLWTVKDFAIFLKMPEQAVYDYRYREKIDTSVFVQCGRKLRVNPLRAIRLSLEGKLIN